MTSDVGVPLAERIAGAGGDLTPSERRLATLITDDPTAAAFATVAELAARAHVSGPTVVRFAAKLGFDGYSALQEHARRSVAAQLRRPTDRLRRDGSTTIPGTDRAADAWTAARDAAVAGVGAVFDALSPEEITALATPVAEATGRVWIVSSETASAAAHVLDNELSLLRPDVHLLAGSGAEVAAELIDAAATDVAIAIDAPRYERRVVDTTRWLHSAGAVVVALTDGPLSPLAALADRWCRVDVPAVGPFDSSLPTIAAVELLVTEVAHQLRDVATHRLDRAETLWALHGVFVDG